MDVAEDDDGMVLEDDDQYRDLETGGFINVKGLLRL
jgi:hypothetical protein